MTGSPLPPDDQLAIRGLYARYNHAISNCDADAWAGCFTADATFSNRATSVSGRAALFDYASGWIEGNARYWIDNLVLEPSAVGATGTCYLFILHVPPAQDPPRISLTGVYVDELVNSEGSWKFASRHIARDV